MWFCSSPSTIFNHFIKSISDVDDLSPRVMSWPRRTSWTKTFSRTTMTTLRSAREASSSTMSRHFWTAERPMPKSSLHALCLFINSLNPLDTKEQRNDYFELQIIHSNVVGSISTTSPQMTLVNKVYNDCQCLNYCHTLFVNFYSRKFTDLRWKTLLVSFEELFESLISIDKYWSNNWVQTGSIPRYLSKIVWPGMQTHYNHYLRFYTRR